MTSVELIVAGLYLQCLEVDNNYSVGVAQWHSCQVQTRHRYHMRRCDQVALPYYC